MHFLPLDLFRITDALSNPSCSPTRWNLTRLHIFLRGGQISVSSLWHTFSKNLLDLSPRELSPDDTSRLHRLLKPGSSFFLFFPPEFGTMTGDTVAQRLAPLPPTTKNLGSFMFSQSLRGSLWVPLASSHDPREVNWELQINCPWICV